MGLLGSGALFMLLRSVGASAGVALLGALTLAVNPLFFSQSFTFMTDVTATSLVAMALLALHGGMGRGAWGLVCLGLLLCAAAVLTRQLALVLAVGFLAATWLHPAARALGRWRLTLLTVVLVCGPWLAWEWTLAASGSTPLGQHQLVRRLIPLLLSGDPQRYLDFAGLLAGRLVATGLGITTFFCCPYCCWAAGQARRDPAPAAAGSSTWPPAWRLKARPWPGSSLGPARPSSACWRAWALATC